MDQGTKLLAAVQWHLPQFDRKNGRTALPRAARALQGWHKRAPRHTRQPLPWPALCLIVHQLLMVLIIFVGYLRPGELKRVCKDAVKPALHGGSNLQFWALQLAREEMEIPSKTGVFDESISFDLADIRWIGELLGKHAATKKPNQALFDLSSYELRDVFNQAQVAAKLVPLGADLYSLRHGEISWDIAAERSTLAETKWRAR